MREQKDIKMLYDYITTNLSSKGIADITKLLINYTNGKQDREHEYPTSVLELAIRNEVEYRLDSIEDERLVNLSIEKYDELVNIITNAIVYDCDSIWESFSDIVSYELNKALEIIESEAD